MAMQIIVLVANFPMILLCKIILAFVIANIKFLLKINVFVCMRDITLKIVKANVSNVLIIVLIVTLILIFVKNAMKTLFFMEQNLMKNVLKKIPIYLNNKKI